VLLTDDDVATRIPADAQWSTLVDGDGPASDAHPQAPEPLVRASHLAIMAALILGPANIQLPAPEVPYEIGSTRFGWLSSGTTRSSLIGDAPSYR